VANFRPLFQRFDTFLVAAVAPAGTFTVPYPTGTTQQDFDTGLGSVGGEAVINDSDKWTVAAAQVAFAFGPALITVTNSSPVAWAANSKVSIEIDQQAGNSAELVEIPLVLSSVAAAGNIFSQATGAGFRMGLIGTIEYYEAVVKVPAVTAAKALTIQPTVNGVPVNGGALALTSANVTPANIILPAPLITGNNALKAASFLGFVASGVTAFVEGEIVLNIRLRETNGNIY
jgi:hypothetical protein